jgi:predicted GTPase
MLQEYSKQKENLLSIYNMLEGMNSNFVTQNLKMELLQKRDSLQNDQFILAVAGQMKAGKSTLLNAMIFGDDILPADDTELTAKITFITYDEIPSYEAKLYSKSEFAELRTSLRGQEGETEFNKLLNESLENLQDKGYSDYEELLSKKVISGNNFKDLIDFVGKNGVFTPFVNTLTLKTNSNWVKNIIVVDTPGMNSPNKLRDKVVKDWIVKADAVLYCSYAGRAMDATDLTFVRDYMLHISPKHRLFALTKSDLIKGEDKLMNTIVDMINEEWNRSSALIPSRDTVFPVSQMAVLLDKMDKSKLPFTSKMEEEYEMLESRTNFEHCNNQFSKLESAIEKKLIANKDSNVIETHNQYLSTIFDERLQELNEDIDSCKKSLELINSDKDELKKKKQQINSDIKSIGINFEGIETKIRNHFHDTSSNVKIVAECHDTIKKINTKLDGMPLNDLEKHAASVIDQKFQNCIDNLNGQSKIFSEEFSRGLQRVFDSYDFQMEYLNPDLIKERIKLQCTGFINYKLHKLKSEIGQASRELKANYSETISRWRKFKDFFNSNKTIDKQRGSEALSKFISESVNPMIVQFEEVDKDFRMHMHDSVSKIINQIDDNFRKLLEDKRQEIIVLESDQGKNIEERKQVEKLKYDSLEKQKIQLETIIAEIAEKINVPSVLENSYI